MLRLIPWIIALMTASELLLQTSDVNRSFLAALELRRALLHDPWAARREFCAQMPSPLSLQLLWREGETWVDSCLDPVDRENSAPRYWRIEARPNFRLLFLAGLPITMAIVILS